MFLANDDNPAKLARSHYIVVIGSLVLFASIKLCKARVVCGISIPLRN